MFRVEEGKIFLTRGDDAVIPVLLKIRGEPYEMQDGDTLTLTVRKFGSAEPLFSAVSETNEITVEHEFTDGLEFGKYDADIQLTTWEGKRYTIFPHYSDDELEDAAVQKKLLGLKPLENFWICVEETIP